MPQLNINDKAKINKLYKPTDKEKNLRDWVYKRKWSMEQSAHRHKAEREWDDGDKAWEAIRREKDEGDWQSNYYVPMTTAIVESTLSELIQQLPQPLIIPRGDEDKAKAKVMQAIFEYTWSTANGDDVMKDVMRGSLIHGTAIAQEYYLKDKRMVRDIKGFGKKTKKKGKEILGEEREVLEYDDCLMEYVNPWMFLVDEKAHEINRGVHKARDVIRKFYMNYRDAKEFFSGPVWDHLNNFRFVRPGQSPEYYMYYKPPEGVDHDEEVEVLWYWGRTPEDLLVITINDVVVRMGPNLYKHKQLPFAKAIDVKRLGQFYGKGEPALLESIQDEANTLRRMTIDRHHLDIDKMFLVDNQTVLDEEDLIARPHGMIPVNDPAAVKAVEYGDIPISVERTNRAINEDKIAVTGVDDRFQSVQKAPSTATEAAILKESTLKRVRMKLRNYEQGFLYDIGRMRVSNIMQFYSQPKLEKIVGQKGTAEFKKEVAKLARQGLLEVRNGTPFKKEFKTITTEGTELFPDARGEIQTRKKPGFHFFTINPEFWLPTGKMGFDIRFEAGPALPVSKPLMQSKISEMYDRILPIADPQFTNYSAEKLADELVKANELNPEDLKSDEAMEAENVEQSRSDLLIDLAAQENELVLRGEDIPEFGTPFADPSHNMVHIEFLKSEKMKQVDQEVFNMLLKHTIGEQEAIQQRGGAGGAAAQGQPPGAATAGGIGQGNQNAVPAIVEGGNQVPTGRALGNG
jgi:hypothetical protein